jgi:hypothetical protein
MMEMIDMAIQEIGVMDARRSLTALIEAAQVVTAACAGS